MKANVPWSLAVLGQVRLSAVERTMTVLLTGKRIVPLTNAPITTLAEEPTTLVQLLAMQLPAQTTPARQI